MIKVYSLKLSVAVVILNLCASIVCGQEIVDLLASEYDRSATMDYPEVRAAIQLSAAQAAELQKLSREKGLQRLRFKESLADLPPEVAAKLDAEHRDKLNAQLQIDRMAVLLPHQLNRLNQLANQTYLGVRDGGYTNLDRLVDYLRLSAAQRTAYEQVSSKANEKETALRTELMKKRREMQKESKREILALLKEDQRKKMNSLLGQMFDFTVSSVFADHDPFRELTEPSMGVMNFLALQPIDMQAYETGFWQSPERQVLLTKGQTRILEELEVSQKQLDEIAEVDRKIVELNSKQGIGKVGKFEGTDELMEEYGEILLKHQVTRAKELALQLKVLSGRAGAGYNLFSKELTFSKDQENDIKELIEELHERLLKSQKDAVAEMLKINQEYYESFLELLSMHQREQVSSLIGELNIPEYEIDHEKRIEDVRFEGIRRQMQEATRRGMPREPGR